MSLGHLKPRQWGRPSPPSQHREAACPPPGDAPGKVRTGRDPRCWDPILCSDTRDTRGGAGQSVFTPPRPQSSSTPLTSTTAPDFRAGRGLRPPPTLRNVLRLCNAATVPAAAYAAGGLATGLSAPGWPLPSSTRFRVAGEREAKHVFVGYTPSPPGNTERLPSTHTERTGLHACP